MTRVAPLALILCLHLPSLALARRASLEPPSPAIQAEADRSDEAAGDARGMGAVPGGRVRMLPPPPPMDADLRAALRRAQPDLRACLEAAGHTGTLRVDARVDTSHALTVQVRPRPADEGVRACAELVAQRALANVARGAIRRPLRASITVRRPRVAPVPPRRPPSPPRVEDRRLAGPVHARLDQDRVGLLQCLSTAAPGVVGRATLRVTLQPDGSLVLSSASLPTGVPAGPALPCRSARIGVLRFAPAPLRPLPVEHAIELGL